jgi:hypothetical protein
MSKKKAPRAQRAAPRRNSPSQRKRLALGLVALLILAGALLAHWRSVRVFTGTSAPPPVPSPGLSLSKEYVYAGGKLVALDEPPAAPQTPDGPPPTNLSATAISGTQVALSWTAPAGAISYYQVERSQNVNGPYTALSPQPTTASFTDTTASSGTAYLYRVRAAFTTGGFSAYSNRDLATTVIFDDDPLVAGVTLIRAQHLVQLRQAVNAVRALASPALSPAAWTDASPQWQPIRLIHVQELRSNLDEALAALSLPVTPYTDPTLSTSVRVRADHFNQLRQRVK